MQDAVRSNQALRPWAADMPDITDERRSLRRAREALREPGLTALGLPVSYDMQEPPHVRAGAGRLVGRRSVRAPVNCCFWPGVGCADPLLAAGWCRPCC